MGEDSEDKSQADIRNNGEEEVSALLPYLLWRWNDLNATDNYSH